MADFKDPTPHLFAHRGGNAAGAKTENTLTAFKSAVRLGYKFLETDVIATKDGHAITYHGSANLIMKLIFGLEIRRKVQSLNYKELEENLKPGGEKTPKLEKVLSELENQFFCIDVKTKEAILPLVEAVKRQKAQNRVVLTSFSRKRAISANKILYGNNFQNACLCIYRTKGRLMSLFPSLTIMWLRKQGFSYVHIPHKCITRRLIKEARKQNFKIYAYTVNDEKSIRKLLKWGVDGIISDNSKLLMSLSK